jgi:hypothetical protein
LATDEKPSVPAKTGTAMSLGRHGVSDAVSDPAADALDPSVAEAGEMREALRGAPPHDDTPGALLEMPAMALIAVVALVGVAVMAVRRRRSAASYQPLLGSEGYLDMLD